MPNLIALFRLQQADNKIQDIAGELELTGKSGQTDPDLLAAQAELEQSRLQKREAERLQKDAELKLAALESEKKKVEGKLFGGKVTNPKELSGYERDLQQLLKQRSRLDGQVLEGMEKLDKLNRELAEKEKAFREEAGRREERENARVRRAELLRRQMEELESRRADFAKGLDEPLLEEYQGLKERKGGIAVAKIQKNTCSACYMLVPESTVKKVRVLELEYCSSCGRILYMDKEQP